MKALTKRQKRGLYKFITYGCANCHFGTLVGGLTYAKFLGKTKDLGRYYLTKRKEDKFIFKVPSLRNVEKTAPYFHDGSVKSLREAIRIMAKVQLSRELSEEDVEDIYSFLKSLTGKIPEEALKLPVLP